ncbi:MAG: response regulator, partial [bacterium]|nr:response regulator [bacterium]
MLPVSLTVLAIDDDPGDIELLRRSLEGLTAFAINFVACPSMQEGRDTLQNHQVDVIILDYLLGGDTGLVFLQELRSKDYRRPIIMLTGK